MKEFTINGLSSKVFGLVVQKSTRSVLPTFSDDYITIPGRNGLKMFPRELQNNEMRIELFKRCDNPAQWVAERRSIVSWLHTFDQAEFTFDDDLGMTYIGKVSESNVPSRYMPAIQFEIVLNLQPFAFGPEKISVVTIPNVSVHTIKEPVSPNTFDTPYLMTITPTVTSSSIGITLNGATLTYSGDIPSGSTITIDTDLMEFRVNGDLILDGLSGEFANLDAKEDNDFIYFGIAGIVRLTYRERFL